jgi:hypothetical protein
MEQGLAYQPPQGRCGTLEFNNTDIPSRFLINRLARSRRAFAALDLSGMQTMSCPCPSSNDAVMLSLQSLDSFLLPIIQVLRGQFL